MGAQSAEMTETPVPTWLRTASTSARTRAGSTGASTRPACLTQVPTTAPEALEVLVAADWPGNVRQLRTVVEHVAQLATGTVISAELVRSALGHGAEPSLPSFDEARDEFTRNYLMQLLQVTRGNVTRAARLAGRNRTDFYKLLGRHGVQPEEFKKA